MISEFVVYLRLGLDHILDPSGYDHLLFIVALTVMYQPRAWRQVVVLVTAFTVGHSATLALATFGSIRVATDWIEWLIPVTILLTALFNMSELWWNRRRSSGTEGTLAGSDNTTSTVAGGLGSEVRVRPSGARPGWDDALEPNGARRAKYALALVFGLIHGLGFSNFLRAALGAGSSIAGPLFAFNVGLELGQVLVVAGVLAATGIVTGPLGWSRRRWIAGLSGATAAVALYIVGTRLPF